MSNMREKENRIIGFVFLIGGIFDLIFVGELLIDLLSKIILYFMLVFFIIAMLYGVILILMGVFILSLNIRINKIVALIILLIGVLTIFLSITVIIIDSFTIVNIFEIVSGLGIIFLGIWIFFHPTIKDEGIKRGKKIISILALIIGLLISLPYGFSLILTMILRSPEFVLYEFPFLLIPLIFGIALFILSIYSIKTTHTTLEIKKKSIFSILIGTFILVSSGFAINSMINHSHYYTFYTPYFPLFFLSFGFVLILYGLFLNKNIRKKSSDT